MSCCIDAKKGIITSTSSTLNVIPSQNKYTLRNSSLSAKKHLKLEDDFKKKGKKRKRSSNKNEKMTNIINNIEKEIKEQLDLQTEENDFTTRDVKTILKEVIVDEDIKDMVRKMLHPGDSVTDYEPKLTRAKVRELLKVRPHLALPILWPRTTPNANFVSECLSLIQEEFSENSSEDEEYKPDDDDKSEYADSLLLSKYDNLHSVHGLNDSFDLPDEKCNADCSQTFEDNICHRTRSKHSLTETPLEVIEQSFNPPDVTSDMYETECDKGDVWQNFLAAFLQPMDKLYSEHADIDDDPEDPEYTIQADEETVDREELRKDKAVEVPFDEAKSLIAELFRDYEPTFANILRSDELRNTENFSTRDNVEVKAEQTDSVEKPRVLDVAVPSLLKSDLPILTESQKLLIQQQLRQHVQLTLMHFLQCYKHPVLFVYASRMKSILESLRTLAGLNKKSWFYTCNLDSALKLISEWEEFRADVPISTTIITPRRRRGKNQDEFSNQLMKVVCKSSAFIYPLMLPTKPFFTNVKKNIHKRDMTESEEWLLASGLQQFTEYVQSAKLKKSLNPKREMLKLVAHYLFQDQFTPTFLNSIIKRNSSADTINPVNYYMKTKRVPPLKHYILPICIRPLCQQPVELLPEIWKQYVLSNFFIVSKKSKNPDFYFKRR